MVKLFPSLIQRVESAESERWLKALVFYDPRILGQRADTHHDPLRLSYPFHFQHHVIQCSR